MKIIDANILIYAVNEDDDRHERSRTWLDDALVATETVGFAWIVLLAFLRLTTRPGLFPHPLSAPEANERVRAWLDQPASVVIHPTVEHATVLADLLARVGTGGNLVSDAHLATLALEHGADVVSFDRDFARFPGVRVVEP